MTNESRRKNIEAEVARGDEPLESAALLLAAGKLADAVSRACYGAFHYARALFLMLGEEVRSHGGRERLLQRDLVRSGLLDPDIAKLVPRLQKFRQDADDTAELVFTANAARGGRGRASVDWRRPGDSRAGRLARRGVRSRDAELAGSEHDGAGGSSLAGR